LWYWDQEDPLELIAAALFNKPRRYKKESLSRILEGKTFRTVLSVIYLTTKNKYDTIPSDVSTMLLSQEMVFE
jgi:hypothetical protein